MGYSDWPFVLLAVAFFVAIRRGNWWWAACSAFSPERRGHRLPPGRPGADRGDPRSWPAERWTRWSGKLAAIALRCRDRDLSRLGQRGIRGLPPAARDPAATGPPRRVHRPGPHDLPCTDQPGARAPLGDACTSHGSGSPSCCLSSRSGACRSPTRPSCCASSSSRFGVQPRLVRALRPERVPARDRGRDPARSGRVAGVTFVLSGAGMAIYAVLAFQGATSRRASAGGGPVPACSPARPFAGLPAGREAGPGAESPVAPPRGG